MHPACVLTCYWVSIFHLAASGCLRVERPVSTAREARPKRRTTLGAHAVVNSQTAASARYEPRKYSDHCHTWSCSRCALCLAERGVLRGDILLYLVLILISNKLRGEQIKEKDPEILLCGTLDQRVQVGNGLNWMCRRCQLKITQKQNWWRAWCEVCATKIKKDWRN